MKTTHEKELFLEALKKTPIIQVACEKTNISRATYYRWLKEDEEFNKASKESYEHGINLINDLTESQLITLIKEKHPTAIFYWLNNNHPRYSNRIVSMSQQEKNNLIKSILSPDQDTAYKHLTKSTIQGKIPNILINPFISIIDKLSNNKNLKADSEKYKLLSKLRR